MTQHKTIILVRSLDSVVAAITATDINILSVSQGPAPASRRLLQTPANSTADVHLQLNAHSAGRVAAVGASLATAVSNGLVEEAMNANNVWTTNVTLTAASPAALAVNLTCIAGSIAGTCIGAPPDTVVRLSTAALVCIALAAGVLCFAATLAAAWCCCRRRTNKERAGAGASPASPAVAGPFFSDKAAGAAPNGTPMHVDAGTTLTAQALDGSQPPLSHPPHRSDRYSFAQCRDLHYTPGRSTADQDEERYRMQQPGRSAGGGSNGRDQMSGIEIAQPSAEPGPLGGQGQGIMLVPL